MKKILKYSFTIAAFSFLLGGCSKDDDNAPSYPDLNTFLQGQPKLSIFNAALDKAGLQNFRTGPGPFTWFAPSDSAFTAIGLTADSISRMKVGDVSYLMMYHLVNASLTTEDMIAQNSFPRGTNLGNTASTQVFLGQGTDSYFVNGTRISSPNNMVSNGVVHIIDRVNTPPSLRSHVQSILGSTGQHSLFIAALTKASRWAQLTGSTFTVFAPTDAAMTAAGFTSAAIAAAPTARIDSIVRYHYITNTRLFTNDIGNKITPQTALGSSRLLRGSGNGTMISGQNNTTPVNITRSDILGVNGVVHVIDGVLRY